MIDWLETVALAAFMAGLMGGRTLCSDVWRHRVYDQWPATGQDRCPLAIRAGL